MPRLSWRWVAAAWKEHPFLPLLLRTCREFKTARLELQWLEQHAQKLTVGKSRLYYHAVLQQLCQARSHGTPLQYVLGTEFFGQLELKCKPGVLIPRQETAAYTLQLVNLLERNVKNLPSKLQVLDLCTGSGCISLLLAHAFSAAQYQDICLNLLGVDVSGIALGLARENKRKLSCEFPQSRMHDVAFLQADILCGMHGDFGAPGLLDQLQRRDQLKWDIMIANPPYISPGQFDVLTERSVRKFEPRIALVPNVADAGVGMKDSAHGDFFYKPLLALAEKLNVKVFLVEVGDLAQAKRVVSMARESRYWTGTQMWRDYPNIPRGQNHRFGAGDETIRSVLLWAAGGSSWIAPAAEISCIQEKKKNSEDAKVVLSIYKKKEKKKEEKKKKA